MLYLHDSCILLKSPASPDQSKSRAERVLTEEEVNMMRQRIEFDRRDYIPDTLTGYKLRHYLSDVTLWAYGFLSMSSAM